MAGFLPSAIASGRARLRASRVPTPARTEPCPPEAPALGAGLMTPPSTPPEDCPARTQPRPPGAPALGAGLMTPPSTPPEVCPARTQPRPPSVDRAAHIERSMYPILYRSAGGSSRRRPRFRWRALRRASRSDPWSRSHFAEPGTSSSLQALKRFECSSQPKPPVANHQPTGRREFIAFIPAGVFLELIRPGSDRPVRPARNRVFPCCPAHPSGT
jgi:hypothetical protein